MKTIRDLKMKREKEIEEEEGRERGREGGREEGGREEGRRKRGKIREGGRETGGTWERISSGLLRSRLAMPISPLANPRPSTTADQEWETDEV